MRQGDGRVITKCGIIALTPDCNQDCLFCFEAPFRKQKKKLTPEDVKEIADSLAARGFTRMVFIGGEATVSPEFPSLCRYISDLGITVCLTTNGRRLASETYVKKLFDAGLAHIEFSIHTHVPEDADYLSSRKGTASKQKAALENIQRLAPRYNPPPTVNTNTVLTTVCAPYLPELVDFVTGFDCVKAVAFKYPTLEGRICDNPHLISRHSDLRSVMLEAWTRCVAAGRKLLLDTFPLCVLPPELVDKTVDFEDKNAILEGWNHEERNLEKRFDKFTLKKSSPACSICMLSIVCEGFQPRYVELFSDREVRPVKSLDELTGDIAHAVRDFLAAKARKDVLRARPEGFSPDASPDALVSWGAARFEEAVRDCYQAVHFSFEGLAACPEAIPQLAETAAAQRLAAAFAADAHLFADADSARRVSGIEKSSITIETVLHTEESRRGLKGILTLLRHGLRENIKVVEMVSDQDSASLITTVRFCRKLGIRPIAFQYQRKNGVPPSRTRKNVAAAAEYVLKTAGPRGPDVELRGFPFDFFPDLHFLYQPPYYEDKEGEIP
ncbi:MAG: radical SAM protein [bacterium]